MASALGATAASLTEAHSPALWGEVGSNSQHAFFQWLHQGPREAPVEFIVPIGATHPVADHQTLLVANALAQAQALMVGRSPDAIRAELTAQGMRGPDLDAAVAARVCPGNRASTMLLMPELSSYRLGQLLAFYEHRTFVEACFTASTPSMNSASNTARRSRGPSSRRSPKEARCRPITDGSTRGARRARALAYRTRREVELIVARRDLTRHSPATGGPTDDSRTYQRSSISSKIRGCHPPGHFRTPNKTLIRTSRASASWSRDRRRSSPRRSIRSPTSETRCCSKSARCAPRRVRTRSTLSAADQEKFFWALVSAVSIFHRLRRQRLPRRHGAHPWRACRAVYAARGRPARLFAGARGVDIQRRLQGIKTRKSRSTTAR